MLGSSRPAKRSAASGQMGNTEVGHLTIGSGRVLDQDFQRVDRAIATAASSRTRRSCPPSTRARTRRRHAPAWPRVVRRRALAHRPPACAARAGEARGDGGPDVDRRVHRRTRRLADVGRARPRGASRRPHRDDLRAVLRDGPGQAVGAHAARARRDPQRARLGGPGTAAEPCRGATTRGSPTSSSFR